MTRRAKGTPLSQPLAGLTPLTGAELAHVMLIQPTRCGMEFMDVVHSCVHAGDLVKQYNRLTGEQLGTAKDDATMGKFARFVYDMVWLRLPPDPREEPKGLIASLEERLRGDVPRSAGEVL